MILVSMGYADQISAYTSFYMYVLPIAGFFIADRFHPDVIMRSLLNVALFHGILGFLFFELFGFANFIGDIAIKFTSGVFQYRMASVSGSIVFGATMVYGLIAAAYFYNNTKNRIYLLFASFITICALLSQQRGAWLASILFFCWVILKNRAQSLKIAFPIFLLIIPSLYFMVNFFPELYDFLMKRINETLGNTDSLNIIDERSHMWFGAIQQFQLNPMGIGVGQGGWISYLQEVNSAVIVTDGDYLRIALESGIIGILFYTYIIGFAISRFMFKYDGNQIYFCWLATATAVQMLGSNITELYYINFAFWLALGITHAPKYRTERNDLPVRIAASNAPGPKMPVVERVI
jgi:O-antigen ligase